MQNISRYGRRRTGGNHVLGAGQDFWRPRGFTAFMESAFGRCCRLDSISGRSAGRLGGMLAVSGGKSGEKNNPVHTCDGGGTSAGAAAAVFVWERKVCTLPLP